MTPRQKNVLDAIAWLEKESPSHEITPRALWSLARDEDHPLHGEFTWDDSEAADLWRDEQARHLLRLRVEVTFEDTTILAPVCVRSPDARGDHAGYVRTTRLIGDEDRARQAMVNEVHRAMSAIGRARDVAVVLGLDDECEALLQRMEKLKAKAA